MKPSLSSLRGIIDYKIGLTRHFYHWGPAMNGMTSRPEAIRQIIVSLDIQYIVETGTFRGTTAEWFAQFGRPFETVEIFERYYAFSKKRLERFPNARIFLDDSVSFLKKRIASGPPLDARQLFYLDSHWEKHLPLREEIELIFNNYTSAVVVIDDFQVDDDPGYGFDNYSSEDQLTLPYMATAKVRRPLSYFFPVTKSKDETGKRRGWVVVTDNSKMVDGLARMPLLRGA